MIIERITMTGADDNTDIQDMLDISKEFPKVEWAILVSKSSEGKQRFPSRDWINRFYQVNLDLDKKLKISTHICGRWVRQILDGTIDWKELPSCLEISDRFQINTHAEPHISTFNMINKLCEISSQRNQEIIFQWDDVNNHLAFSAKSFGLPVSVLFDGSHGAGVLPNKWQYPVDVSWCGYAGGLSPDNVVAELDKISNVLGYSWGMRIWIDMETKVRTEDGMMLDMSKVRDVLAKVSAWQDKHDEMLEPPF